jgi:type IV pilus assembly protein PilE
MLRKRNQKGFTLMELMVVIVIVAILAAVAVPLYINYVKDARRTEAKAAIGALATAMEEYYLNEGSYPGGADVTPLYTVDANLQRKPSNLDQSTVDEISKHWTIALSGGGGTTGYTLTLTGVNSTPYKDLAVEYQYTRGTGGVIKDVDPVSGTP